MTSAGGNDYERRWRRLANQTEVVSGEPPPPAAAVLREDHAFLRAELRHEDGLLSQRVSWLVGSQSFLLTAYCILLNSLSLSRHEVYGRLGERVIAWLPPIALGVVVVSYLTIAAAILRMSWLRRLAERVPGGWLPPVPDSRLVRALGFSGPVLTPALFALIWVGLLAIR